MAHTGSRYNLVALILVLIAAMLSNSVVAARSSSGMVHLSSSAMGQMTQANASMADMDCHGQKHHSENNELAQASQMQVDCGSDTDNSTFDQCCSQPLCMSVMGYLPPSAFTIPLSFNPTPAALSGLFERRQRIESLFRPPIA
ncbi:CopL family metal-binding regulatory protein [Photobacterium sp.]|uniref:CopL family metal-binding regulatory protein n=1 Tax=Photobacterium sp. TaxID=660 RepID=UPI00299F298E|nr:CopL family metal-binding regulatory protein [Photobacterium sp.]MDX1301484.1 CopL family metal-binding regulatory protein [Photobacterium sp.]